MKRLLGPSLAVALLASGAATARAAVSLPAVLGEHAVVQRELPFHVWGQAAPGETVRTSFRGESRTAVADGLGRWGVFHSPTAAGGPFTLTVSASNVIRLDDVWVGDVWLVAGQSNMEFTLADAEGAANEIPQARQPEIRFLRAARRTSSFPLTDAASEGWKVCTPETAPKFSAVAYFFARQVREHHAVPIGVIDASWGGTPLAAFTPLSAIAADPALVPALLHFSRMADARATTLLELEKEKRELEAAAGARGRRPGPAAAALAPGLRGLGAGRDLQRDGRSVHAVRDPRGALVPGRERRLRRARAGLRPPLPGDDPQLAAGVERWRLPVPLRPARELDGRPRQRLARAARGAAAGAHGGEHGDGRRHRRGPPSDIHPRDKKTVGTRLALAARALAYGERIAYSGPLVRQVVPEGPALRVFFDHAEGLTTRAGAPVEGFEVAGADGRYVPGEGRIEGSTVVVSSSAVAAPRSVRYGWADNPRVSLYNAAGLPASPFRSAE